MLYYTEQKHGIIMTFAKYPDHIPQLNMCNTTYITIFTYVTLLTYILSLRSFSVADYTKYLSYSTNIYYP